MPSASSGYAEKPVGRSSSVRTMLDKSGCGVGVMVGVLVGVGVAVGVAVGAAVTVGVGVVVAVGVSVKVAGAVGVFIGVAEPSLHPQRIKVSSKGSTQYARPDCFIFDLLWVCTVSWLWCHIYRRRGRTRVDFRGSVCGRESDVYICSILQYSRKINMQERLGAFRVDIGRSRL